MHRALHFICFATYNRLVPNAKSVSERIWQMSHHVRPNPASPWHTLDSQAFSLQEVAWACCGYSGWQMSQVLRPNTLSTLGDLSQYPFMRPKPISIHGPSYDKLFALDKP